MLALTDNEQNDQVEVVLRFDPSAVKRLKQSTWYPTQQIKDLPNGSCLFTAIISKANINDCRRWILGWGAEVEVLQPKELREEMIKRARAFEKLYHQHEQELLTTLGNLSALYSSTDSAFIQRMGRSGRAHKTKPSAVFGTLTIDRGNVAEEKVNQGNDTAPSTSKASPVLDFLETARSHLNQHRQERLYQAHTSFKISLIALLVGLFLICVGIICVFSINMQVGIVTTISGAFADFIGIGILHFNKETNDRLDITTRELNLLDRTAIAMQYIERISDLKERNKAIKDLTKNLYTLLPAKSNSKA